jgi:putative colanic acid biosynthesis UDP-glucose lipid carrier transferase
MPMRGLREVPLDLLAQRPLSGWQIVQKSVLDRTLAALMLILMAPLLLGLALLIKLDSPGPVLFRQRRVGMDGVPFDLLKFRTMHVNDTEAALATRATTHGDARITGVGRWLRRLSLDELPEVLNVLRGEMSLVGPRPHMLGAIPLLDQRFADYARRHHVKPGITGWAQINGIRGDVDSHESIRRSLALDCYYIENWSLALDVYVLLRAAAFGDTGRNAY